MYHLKNRQKLETIHLSISLPSPPSINMQFLTEITKTNNNNNNNNAKKLDWKTRKLLTIHGQQHPKADVDRLYVPRKQGGRGLMQLEAAHALEITKLVEYVERKEDPLIQVVRTHQHNNDSAVLQAARCLKTEVKKETRKIKGSIAEKTKERWQGKRMHGQLPRNLDKKPVDNLYKTKAT